MTPTEYDRHWEAYRDQAQAITAKSDALAIRVDTQARDLGELYGFSRLYCYHNAHNWQDASWMTPEQHAAARRILDLQARRFRVWGIGSAMRQAAWDASDANPQKRYRQGHRLTGDTRRNFAALGVSA
jgi:hypothetical protein